MNLRKLSSDARICRIFMARSGCNLKTRIASERNSPTLTWNSGNMYLRAKRMRFLIMRQSMKKGTLPLPSSLPVELPISCRTILRVAHAMSNPASLRVLGEHTDDHFGNQQRAGHEYQARCQRKDAHQAVCTVNALAVARAEILRNEHRRAAGAAKEHDVEKPAPLACHAHCRQRQIAQAADHHGVNECEGGKQQVLQRERNGDGQHRPCEIHILFIHHKAISDDPMDRHCRSIRFSSLNSAKRNRESEGRCPSGGF